jgi:hypothetical protein
MPERQNIAVCIPTRNQSGYIGDTLSSAFAQTQLPVDVVVSDDAGTDDTAAVVEQFRATLPTELRSRLRYDRSATALGIGGNFDRSVRLAKGELVVKLDSDDLLEPGFIEILGKSLEANPKAGWAHCNIWNIRPDKTVMGLAHTRKRSGFYPADIALPAYLNHNDTCHCVMIRKSAYLAVGGYRPEMKTCEDWLLWLEMLLAGWGYAFDSRPLARMRKHPARFDLMTKRRQAFIESCRFMAPRMDEFCRRKTIAGLSAEEARFRFHAALARLCVSSGCDEVDPQVRRELFDCAGEFHPSLSNRLWRTIGAPLPAETTRLWSRMSGWPRSCVRALIQMRRRKSGASNSLG